jgi:hypothetical protein
VTLSAEVARWRGGFATKVGRWPSAFTCSPPEVVDVVGDQPNVRIALSRVEDAAPSSPMPASTSSRSNEADLCLRDAVHCGLPSADRRFRVRSPPCPRL